MTNPEISVASSAQAQSGARVFDLATSKNVDPTTELPINGSLVQAVSLILAARMPLS